MFALVIHIPGRLIVTHLLTLYAEPFSAVIRVLLITLREKQFVSS